MNNDLISRSELKKALRQRQWYIDDIEEVEKIIDNAPTVSLPDFKAGYKQAIIDGKTNFSRPQGEWMDGTQGYYCSECYYTDKEYFNHNFCPNCGAKMEGGKTCD